jgi:LysM repeat protein
VRTLTAALVTAALTATVLSEPVTSSRQETGLQLVATSGTYVGHGKDRRRIVRYVVRRGDTAIGLAVRFHAWTDELLALNHLTYRSRLEVGQHLRIPVVPAELRDEKPPKPKHHKHKHHKHRHHKHKHHKHRHHKHKHHKHRHHRDPSRAHVAHVIARTAQRYGVDPELALAVSWQEAGWQMHHVSGAGAIGAMQVLPTTGTWMSLYVGRRLHLHRLHDNAAAGVMLLRVLRGQTITLRRQIGAYYQGLGAVRAYGLYPETRHYVENVLAIKRRLERGRPPA